MKYQITPFTIILAVVVVYALYSVFITPSGEKTMMGFTMVGFLVPTLVLMAAADYLMQKYISKTWILYSAQIVLVVGFVAYTMMSNAQRKFVMSNQFYGKFIVVVFDVEGSEALPTTNSFEVRLPDDGILFTSTKKEDSKLDKLNQLLTRPGNAIDYPDDYEFFRDEAGTVTMDSKVYHFQSWATNAFSVKPDKMEQIKEAIQKKMKP